jgi:lambda family phage tail tape measure protein
MAKKIEELIVELGIKGLEGLDNLSSSFRNLQKAIGPSDNAITQVRKSILDMSSAGKQSIQMIQGQIDAFKGLQTQATIGSNIYRQLSGDVNRLSDTLRQLRGDYEEVGRAARQTDAQIANQFPARRPEAFRVQLAALNRELGQLSVSARAYGDALTEITIRETAFGRAQARQGAIAGAQAVGAPLIAAMTPQQALPNTTAALRVQLAELTQDFDNLDRSGEQYAQVAQRISEIQEELSRNILGVATAYDRHAAAENAAIRRAEKMRGIQEYYRGRGAATGFRDPGTGAIIAGGAPGTSQPLPIERPMREISGLFQQIGQIGMQPIISNIEMMGSSYEQVAASIKGATAASNGSISSLQAQRGAWQQLRAQLDPASAGFKQAGREIEQLDRRLERFQQRRRRMGAMEATQAAGAVISGGIFGGPEGAIGGAIGTAVGGVPGAFAGAAIGAQVGGIRQSLGAMASFTAEIDKQRIALRNVVGSQEAYNSSLQFIDATSRRLAIPQDQLNKQFTQLAASVVGAGGNVDAAKAAFEGIAAGIRGTGGSLQDLQGALLATSQVFGKGKVSAEELRQQIGERMPGAFSIFAESIGKTPQELDKMLSRGEVGLNDFMNFVQELSKRYGASAAEIAASSQAAGDRMQVTFARLREAIGRELQPIGAGFQETFAGFFEENEGRIVAFASAIASAAKVVGDFLNTIGKLVSAMQDTSARTISGVAAAINSVLSDIGRLVNRVQNAVNAIGKFFSDLFASVVSVGKSALNSVGVDTDAVGRFMAGVFERVAQVASNVFGFIQNRWKDTVRNMVNYSTPLGWLLKGAGVDAGQAVVAGMEAGMGGGGGRTATPPAPRFSMGASFAFPTDDTAGSAGGGKAAKGLESRAAELQLELNLLRQMGDAESLIAEARQQGDDRLAAMLTTLQAQTRLVTEAAKVELEKIPAQDKALRLQILQEQSDQESAKLAFVLLDLEKKATEELKNSMEQISKQVDEFKNRSAFEREYGELIMQGTLPATARQYLETKKVVDETLRAAEAALAKAEADGASADEIERQRKELERIRGAGQEELGRIQGGDDPSKIISSAIIRIQGELNELMNIGNQVVGAANAIGDAFGNSFKGILTGSMTAKEALRNFFSSLADYFADMAAKMIAQWIKLAILNSILKLFPGGGGGLSNLSAPATINNPLGVLNANGNAFAQNGIVPYAKGGIVNSPTLFKFAKGGSMATGVMGEAGPEAIMPLKRGADGKLGVQATGGGGVTVNVSVDAKGTQVEGDPGQGQQLGRVIAGAVQAEIIKQQRPGGLLGNTR